jgi:membrane associated rhomboid family serine protease
VVVYSFLNWLLFIRFQVFKVDEDVLNVIVPIVLPGIPISIWLRPRLKLLQLKSKGKDALTGYIVMAWFVMLAPVLVAQAYMVTATGKLTKLDEISEIIHQPPTKYYMAKRFYINKHLTHSKSVFDISGKYDENLNMTIYASVPVFDHVFPDTNMIAAIRTSTDPRVLVIINGKVSSMQQLKKLPADSISRMRYVNATMVMPKYGDAGKYGALAVITRGYKTNEKLPTAKIAPVAWLGVKFKKTISSHLSIPERKKRFEQFATACDSDFRREKLDEFIYLERTPNSKDTRYFMEAVRYPDDVEMTGEPIILIPLFEPFEARNGHKLAWVFGSLGIGSVLFLIFLLFKPMKTPAELRKQAKEKHNIAGGFKTYFFPREGYYITPIIIDINLAVFILMVFAGLGFVSFNTDDLLKWGADYRPYVIHGEYWRLFTCMFLHGGLMHVALNMYGLLFVGIFLEPVMGRGKYAFGYLFTGIAASLTSIWWHTATVSVGASGAVFGMYGIFFALLTTSFFRGGFGKPFLISTVIFIVFNLLLGLTPGIDNAAHIGGLLSGILIGYALYPSIKKEMKKRQAQAAEEERAAMAAAWASIEAATRRDENGGHYPEDDAPKQFD